ncbi:hypothetical protein CLOP_g18220 [Closterium sp. NIES-67]|nr:hypothetical protein CLOP_g18220 [Closterium sp. NIES-67]
MVSAKRLLLFLWLLAATCQCLSLRHIPPHDPEATAADDGVSSLATNVDGPLDSTTGDDSASNADVLAENPPTAVPVNPDGISNPNFFPVSSESGSATSSSDSTALYIVRLHSALPLAAYRGAVASFSGWGDDDADDDTHGGTSVPAGLAATAEAVGRRGDGAGRQSTSARAAVRGQPAGGGLRADARVAADADRVGSRRGVDQRGIQLQVLDQRLRGGADGGPAAAGEAASRRGVGAGERAEAALHDGFARVPRNEQRRLAVAREWRAGEGGRGHGDRHR